MHFNFLNRIDNKENVFPSKQREKEALSCSDKSRISALLLKTCLVNYQFTIKGETTLKISVLEISNGRHILLENSTSQSVKWEIADFIKCLLQVFCDQISVLEMKSFPCENQNFLRISSLSEFLLSSFPFCSFSNLYLKHTV